MSRGVFRYAFYLPNSNVCVSPQGKITDIYYTFTYCMGVRVCMSIYVKYIIFSYISDKKTADFVVGIHLE